VKKEIAKKRSGVTKARRKRSAVLKDFERVAGPLRGQNRDQKPKA
jgi:hypothetical protein